VSDPAANNTVSKGNCSLENDVVGKSNTENTARAIAS